MNPITEYRRQHRLTHRELAELAGCTANAVLRCEQGLYTKILPCIQDLLPPGSHTQYLAWQKEHRSTAAERLPAHASPTPGSPLYNWRNEHGKSAIGACIILCMHPSVWANMESGKTKSFSTNLLKALNDGAYPIDFVEDLRTRHETWAEDLRVKNQKVKNYAA